MRILHIFTLLSPNTNGTIATIRQLSLALANRGHKVGIFTSDLGMNKEYIDSLKPVEIHNYPTQLNLPGLYLFLSLGMVTEARRIVKEFDIVHLHCFRSLQNIVVCHYTRKYKVPYVLDAHGSTLRETMGRKGPKWLLRILFDGFFGYSILKRASKVIAETKIGVQEYKALGVKKNKIIIIPSPLAVDEFSHLPTPGQFRSKYGIGNRPLIMFMGRINEIKGLDFLVRSFYEVAQIQSDVILAVVGNDDGYKSTLESQIDGLGLSDKVIFPGFLSGEGKLSALVDADVFVQVSRYEQGAWAPIEAILCGTPIIVTENTGAGEDIKRLDAGYLVKFGDTKGLAKLILKIIKNPKEPITKAKKAAEYVRRNMSMTKGVEDYEKLYAECIALGKQG